MTTSTVPEPRVSRVKRTPLTKLRPHPDNPRTISPDALKQLMRQLEADPDMLQARPLLALPDGTVIAGNQRLHAAVELGWDSIPVVTVDLTDEQARAWMIRDNTSAGDWNMQMLADALGGLPDGFDPALTGLSPQDLTKAIARLRTQDPRDPDAALAVPEKPRSTVGTVYELGPHLVMCGDSTNPEHVRHLFSQPHHHALDQVGCVWTDPPYGVNYVGKTADELTIQNDTPDGLVELLAGAFQAMHAGLAPHARFYVAGPPGTRAGDFLAAFEAASWRLHQILVWVKHRMVLGHSDYHYRHELLFYGWATDPEWPGRPGRGKHQGSRWYGGNDATSVLEADAPARSEQHPTMKPVALIEQCLANSTRPNDVVYDPFGGSGSTLIACERLGRRARLMEIDPGYCDVIRDRYSSYTET